MTHLKYDYNNENKPKGYAPDVLKKLGIIWRASMPQCLGDSFWFFYCKNMPDELPEYISELPSDILEMFFTKEEVERIEKGAPFRLPKPIEWIIHEEVKT